MKKIIFFFLSLLSFNFSSSIAKEITNESNANKLANELKTPLIAESIEIRTVVIEGFGTNFPDAAQNAAKNGLMQVVGSFIDAETILENQVKINTYLSIPIIFAISKQVFLLTNEANFLSNTPSFSPG